MNGNAFYRIFPETARNFEGDILRDLRRGFNVRVEFREPVRVGPLMVAPELARLFLGSVQRPNPRRKRKGA